MTKKRTGTEAEWREHGRKFHLLRNELQKALIEIQSLLPQKHTDKCFRAVQIIDEFRSSAEGEMYKRGGPKNSDVWYPGSKARGKISMGGLITPAHWNK